jgi:polysaccharide biosynthesis transport protein
MKDQLKDQQIVPVSGNSSLPIVQVEAVQDGRYYQALTAIPVGERSDWQEFFDFIRRRLWLILGVSALTMTGLGAFIMTRPPVYEGKFRMLVEPVTRGQDQLSQTLELASGESDVNNQASLDYKSQIEVLLSQRVLTPILGDLRRQEPKLDYQSLVQDRLSIRNPKDTKLLDVTFRAGDRQKVEAALRQLATRFIQYSTLERNSNLQQGIGFVDQQIAQQQREVSRLELQVEQLRRRNDIFRPDVSAEALSKQLTELLDKRRQVQAELAAAQTLYGKLQQQLGLNPADAVAVSNLSESPTYQTLISKLRELEAQIAIASAKFQPDSPMMLDLLDQREKLLPLITDEARRIGSRGNAVNAPPNQSTVFQGSIGQNMGQQLVDAANRTQMLRAQGEALVIAETQLRQQTRNFAGFARAYDAVQRNLKISADSLTRLMTARENLQLELTRQTMPWQLISKIDQDSIYDASGRARQFVIAALASTLLGLVAAWIAEKLDPSFHTVDDLTSDLKFTCLGKIPFDPRKRRDAVNSPMLMPNGQARGQSLAIEQVNSQYNGTSPFMEAFYSTYTNIRLLGTDSPIKILTVVSTSPGDGKTTVSTNLALAAANLGERVLLVDADLRWPRLHLGLDLPNIRGLSNCLTSDDVELEKIYQTHPEEENLAILTAGPQPPDAPRLLTSNRLRSLIERWRQDFDLVVFDTPPLGHFVDAKLIASISDGTVMVVSLNKTERQKAKQVFTDLVAAIPTRLLGGIVNGVKAPPPDAYYSQAYRQIEEQKIALGRN